MAWERLREAAPASTLGVHTPRVPRGRKAQSAPAAVAAAEAVRCAGLRSPPIIAHGPGTCSARKFYARMHLYPCTSFGFFRPYYRVITPRTCNQCPHNGRKHVSCPSLASEGHPSQKALDPRRVAAAAYIVCSQLRRLGEVRFSLVPPRPRRRFAAVLCAAERLLQSVWSESERLLACSTSA